VRYFISTSGDPAAQREKRAQDLALAVAAQI
jgi:hypothetical protein